MSRSDLTRETRIVASGDQVSAELNAETVILSIREGVYFGLDRVGTCIWGLVQEPRGLGEIAVEISTRFEVDEPTAFADLVALVTDMLERGLVTVDSGAGS